MSKGKVFGIVCLLAAMVLSLQPSKSRASDWGWIMSIPHALSGQQVYKVRILEIDGQSQQELVRYSVSSGSHLVTVELMLDLEWEPDLSDSTAGPAVKQLELAVEAGKSYLLAGRVDVNAPIEAQLDQSYWEPVVYRVK